MIAQAVLVLTFVAGSLCFQCCTPPQWEGNEGFLGGYARFLRTPRLVGESFKVSYDSVNKKVATSGNAFLKSGDDRQSKFKVIFRYDEGRGYFINYEKESCYKFNLKYDFRNACIPDSARKFEDTFFGAGAGAFNITPYAISYQGDKADFNIFITVTSEGCIPVSEAIYGKVTKAYILKDYFLETVGFTGITPGIESQSVFEPPSYCNSSSSAEYIGEDFEHNFRIFHF